MPPAVRYARPVSNGGSRVPVATEMESLIKSKRFDDVEARWMSHQEQSPQDLDYFFESAQALKNAGEKKRSMTLLSMLAESLAEKKLWIARLTVLEETVRLSSAAMTLVELKKKLRQCLENAYEGRPSLTILLDKFGFDAAGTPTQAVESTEKVRKWIPYDVGGYFFMAENGAGRVVDINLTLGNVKIDFEKRKGISVPVGAAPKYLIPLPKGHILRDHLEKPKEVQESIEREPALVFRHLLESFGRPLTATEIKGALSGVVPDSKWPRFWNAVQKHPQVVLSGKGKTAKFGWSESVDAASDQLRRQFDEATVERKLELAKKHGKRSEDLGQFFAVALTEAAGKLKDSRPALAFEVLLTLEKLPSHAPLTWDAAALVRETDSTVLLKQLTDRALREKALTLIREARPDDWASIYRDAFLREEDQRTLNRLADTLATDSRENYTAVIEDILRQPRRHPARFLWFLERTHTSSVEGGSLPARVDLPLLGQMMSAVDWDEFGMVRPRVRALFDRGSLAIRIVNSLETEDQGRQVLTSLLKVNGLEGFRKAVIEEATFRKFPALRQQVGPEALFATAESAEQKRKEVEHLLKVELPANGQAMKEAVALGDLSENFEYKSARQKHEYLTARIAKLQEELSRVRIIKPEEVDTSEVRVGTKLLLRDGGEEKVVTILGPWESRPEDAVFSYQSELGASLLGKRPGDEIRIGDESFKIEKIRVWNEA